MYRSYNSVECMTTMAINKIDKKLYLCINKIFFDPFTYICFVYTKTKKNYLTLIRSAYPRMHIAYKHTTYIS